MSLRGAQTSSLNERLQPRGEVTAGAFVYVVLETEIGFPETLGVEPSVLQPGLPDWAGNMAKSGNTGSTPSVSGKPIGPYLGNRNLATLFAVCCSQGCQNGREIWPNLAMLGGTPLNARHCLLNVMEGGISESSRELKCSVYVFITPSLWLYF